MFWSLMKNLKNTSTKNRNFTLIIFYFLIGEHYESIINKVNFFHFAAEAILLELL